jgi:hypothetical protein
VPEDQGAVKDAVWLETVSPERARTREVPIDSTFAVCRYLEIWRATWIEARDTQRIRR